MEWMPSDQAYIVTCAGKLFEEVCMNLQMVCFHRPTMINPIITLPLLIGIRPKLTLIY